MADEYTPTDEQVRDGFVWLSAGDDEAARELAEEDYDRWLSAHDARVRAEAAREVAASLTDEVNRIQSSVPNPLDWQTGVLAGRDWALDCARRFEKGADQ